MRKLPAMLAYHPLANIFPLLEGREFSELVEDIAAHGLAEEIVLLGGSILDGRNRYRALVELAGRGAIAADELDAARSPNFFRFEEPDGDPLAFVISKNLRRRQLNESQRAMVAAKLANMRQGERTDLAPPANLPKVSQESAAGLLNISERSVRSAKTVVAEGSPELQRAVETGELKVSAAAGIARLPKPEQAELVARGADEIRKMARQLRAGDQAEKRRRREAKERTLGQRQMALPEARYGVIYADPPWRFAPYSPDTGMDRAADNHYPTMGADAIAALKAGELAAADCALFLWATAPMLPQALAVMAAWGFEYKSHCAWKKIFPGGRKGTGYWWRNEHELLLLGSRGKIPAPAPGRQWGSVIPAPVGRHSEKPVQFRQMIENYFPTLPRIELFARQAAAGWDAWGNEATRPADATYDHMDAAAGETAAEAAGILRQGLPQAEAQGPAAGDLRLPAHLDRANWRDGKPPARFEASILPAAEVA